MRQGIDPQAKPSGDGCVECLAQSGWWLHLRRCAACGHIGCCESSPSQHASHHSHESGHPVVASFEPGEDWFFSYETGETFQGPELAVQERIPALNQRPDQPAECRTTGGRNSIDKAPMGKQVDPTRRPREGDLSRHSESRAHCHRAACAFGSGRRLIAGSGRLRCFLDEASPGWRKCTSTLSDRDVWNGFAVLHRWTSHHASQAMKRTA